MSLDPVLCVPRLCPVYPWTQSCVSLDPVLCFPGPCPLCPWTLSCMSLDLVLCVAGSSPVCPWTMSLVSLDHVLCSVYPWTLSFVSLEPVLCVPGPCPVFPIGQCCLHDLMEKVHACPRDIMQKNLFKMCWEAHYRQSVLHSHQLLKLFFPSSIFFILFK